MWDLRKMQFKAHGKAFALLTILITFLEEKEKHAEDNIEQADLNLLRHHVEVICRAPHV